MAKERPSFKQQNLPAWQPILTAGTVLPTFFLIGVAFVPIGIGLLMSSSSVHEKVIDYTHCKSHINETPCSQITESIPGKFSARSQNPPCKCILNFTLPYDFKKDVFVYYSLTNFYQNHRRYVKSRDDVQLLGNPQSVGSECYPFDYGLDVDGKKKPIAPCGAIANSLFNDTFALKKVVSSKEKVDVFISRTGIAWSSDKNIRFQNPKPANDIESLKKAFENTVKPPNWHKPVYNLTKDLTNTGFQNEDLIVWMRTAALPTFRKLWGIVMTDSAEKDNSNVLTKGIYQLSIDYNYPVVVFGGTKRFILSNTSWLGGKNNFLGIAYIIVGCICFLLSALFLIIHKKYGKLSTEIIQINQSTPYLT